LTFQLFLTPIVSVLSLPIQWKHIQSYKPLKSVDFKTEEVKTKRHRRRRRGRRSACSTSESAMLITQLRRIPAYQLLSDQGLARIEHQADWLLEHVGMEFQDDPIALEIFDAAGAQVVGQRVKFAPGLVRSLCASAPDELEIHCIQLRWVVIMLCSCQVMALLL